MTLNGLKDAIITSMIKNLAVTSEKINDLAITTGKIINDAITTAKIINDAITSDKIIADAVTTVKIINLAITNAKLGLLSVKKINLGTGTLHFQFNIANDQTNAGVTEFMGLAGELSAGEVARSVPAIRDGLLRKLKIHFASNTLDVIAKFTVNINTVATALTVNIPAGNSDIATIEIDVAISEDDLISVEIETPTGTGAINYNITLDGVYDNV